jgi:heme exporter protein C
MGIGFVNSIKSLRNGPSAELYDAKAVSSIRTGIAFGVMGLLTGSLWARFTWGAWWVNDPQLNGAMVTVLIYAGYLILRASISDPSAKTRLSGVYSLFAFIILMILLMVLPRFTESLHPGKGGNPAFSKYDLDSALRLVFYPAVIGWMLLGTWMYTLALRAEKLRANIQRLQEH